MDGSGNGAVVKISSSSLMDEVYGMEIR